MASFFEQIGGEAPLREIVEDFIGQVIKDPIIGFFFVNVDSAKLVQLEFEFASAHLGGPAKYTGRTMPESHRKHPINPGHFHRRMWLLEQTLDKHGVPENVKAHWLAHNRRLQAAVVSAKDCIE